MTHVDDLPGGLTRLKEDVIEAVTEESPAPRPADLMCGGMPVLVDLTKGILPIRTGMFDLVRMLGGVEDRRIPDQDVLDTEVQAWTKERNNNVVMVDWQFATADARIKLKHLYPKIQV